MVQIGEPAPRIAFTDHTGRPVILEGFRGAWVVLWWYPEANTPGCSRQAASLEESLEEITRAGAVVLGASFDLPEKNNDFVCDRELSFPLLSDPQRTAGAAYGVLRDPDDPHVSRSLRHTFVIDPDGRVAYREDATSLDLSRYGAHIVDVLADLRA